MYYALTNSLGRIRNLVRTASSYFRPGGVDTYKRPDGTSIYLRP